jgi:hypothetical protein
MTIVTHRTNCPVEQNRQEPAHTIRALGPLGEPS